MQLTRLWHLLRRHNDTENWGVLVVARCDVQAIELKFNMHSIRKRWEVLLTLNARHGLAVSQPKSRLRGTSFAGRVYHLCLLSPARNYEHAVEYTRTIVRELRGVLERHPEDIMLLD